VARLALGTVVTVVAVLVRTYTRGGSLHWERHACVPRRGIVVGYRNRNNGHWEYEDGGKWYVADRGFQTVLVAEDLVRSHLVVLPTDVVEEMEVAISGREHTPLVPSAFCGDHEL
jgi:hypothetical protein